MEQKLTPEQLEALRVWKAAYGRSWKRLLLDAWENPGRPSCWYAPELQQIRNDFGPSWLVKFKGI